MKKAFLKITVLFGFLIFTTQAMAQDDATEPDLGTIVADYLDAWAAINEPDTDLADLQHYNSFFTADISYQLPEFDMVFEGEDFLSTEVDNSGNIRNSENAIEQIIVGKGVVFLKMVGTADMRRSEEDDWQTVSHPDFLVFEFEGDKIKRVFDY